jgi:aspartyl-tRNA(Asn)/glutamyl-tRNA(Gln) amidotransferase subunit C
VTDRITRADVEHVAQLARLALDDSEMQEIADQLAAILEHAEDIAELDLDDVEPTAHPLPLTTLLRDDEATPTLDRDEVLAAAPATEQDRFRVPRILDAP